MVLLLLAMVLMLLLLLHRQLVMPIHHILAEGDGGVAGEAPVPADHGGRRHVPTGDHQTPGHILLAS
uniref:Secreted protein n=1 Tax=Arundo donax TaxID=35708 RepID=A0A0A9GCB7_ARUDO